MFGFVLPLCLRVVRWLSLGSCRTRTEGWFCERNILSSVCLMGLFTPHMLYDNIVKRDMDIMIVGVTRMRVVFC